MKNFLLLLILPLTVNAATVKPLIGMSDEGMYAGARVEHGDVSISLDSQAALRVGTDIDGVHVYGIVSTMNSIGAGAMMTYSLSDQVDIDVGVSVGAKTGIMHPELSSFVQFSFSL